jgi:hypothetical protein
MISTSNLLLKIYFDEKIKRCSLPANYRDLRSCIIKSFLNTNIPEMFEVYYLDEEKDLIHIENDYDFENALFFVKQNCHSSLKVTIKSPNEKLDYQNAIKFLDNSTMNSRITISKCKSESRYPDEPTSEDNIFDAQLNCNNCGRKFINYLSHSKHSRNCEKVFCKKRTPFDSKKQRRILNDNPRDFNVRVFKIEKEDLKSEFRKMAEAFRRWKNATITTKTRNIQTNTYKKEPFVDLILNYECKTCTTCNRNFNTNSLQKHSANCLKITNKRKPYDSKKHRILNLEHAVLLRRAEMMQLKKEILEGGMNKHKRIPKWKNQSRKFRTIMRISRLLNKAKFN